jgi:hypothetical protein
VKWRLLLSLIGGAVVALLARVCLDGAASLQERRVVTPATELLEASGRAIEAELNLRGRAVGELAEQVAGDPDLPGEIEASSGRADNRIGRFRGVRAESDAMTLMNDKGVVVGTNAPRYHMGDSLVARPGAPPPKRVAVATPGLLDAVLDGYPSRGVAIVDGVVYHWGAAPVRVKQQVVGAVLIERRLQALVAPGCDVFLVVGGRVVLGRPQEGWRNFVAGGVDRPFLMVAKDAGPGAKRPAGAADEHLGVWAQRFHVPGSTAAVGFVTIDLSPAVAELASFHSLIVNLAILAFLAQTALLLATARLAPVDGRWVRWLGERFDALRRRAGEPTVTLPPQARQSSSTVVLTPPSQPGAAAPAPDGEDAKETPPLGVKITSPLPGIIDALPLPGAAPHAAPVAPPAAPEAGDEHDMDATSTIPMTPELMAELGLSDIPEDPALETQVMNLDDLLAAIKAGPGTVPKLETVPDAAPEAAAPAAQEAAPGAAPESAPAAAPETVPAAAPETAPAAAQATAPESTQQTPPETTQQEAPPSPTAPPAPPSEVAEDPVYREVYTRFIGMRRLCGQPVDLAYEVFKEDLEKSQAQIIAQHGCKRVRFHVLVRSGKAILATTPLP